MVHSTRVALAFLAAAALGAPSGVLVDAHGLLTTPQVEFKEGAMKTSFTEKMTSPFEGKFNGNPQQNADTFLAAYHAKYGADARVGVFDLIKQSGADSECGNSLKDVSAKPIPADGKIVWENPDTHEGFVASHTGPCEVWLNDDIVFQDDNCAGHYPTASKAEISINFSKCPSSGCLLKFYWLTFQEPNWQIYKNCVPLIGNPEVGAEAKMTTTSESSTPTPTEYSSSSSPSPSPTSTESSPSPSPTMAAAGGNANLVADQATSSPPPESAPAPTSSSPASEYTPAPVSGASPTVAHHKCKGKKHQDTPQY